VKSFEEVMESKVHMKRTSNVFLRISRASEW